MSNSLVAFYINSCTLLCIFIVYFQSHKSRAPTSNNSLFDELEMSLSEADMDLHNSTPRRRGSDTEDGEQLPDIFVTTPNNKEINRVSSHLQHNSKKYGVFIGTFTVSQNMK